MNVRSRDWAAVFGLVALQKLAHAAGNHWCICPGESVPVKESPPSFGKGREEEVSRIRVFSPWRHCRQDVVFQENEFTK